MISRLYGSAMNARNTLYERGVLAAHSLGAKTVSIGNITVGGTGKTPLVAFAARVLAEAGETVCILTRGYGRENPKRRVLVSDGENILADVRKSGDEPFELAGKLLGKAIIVADANRVATARWAREQFGITAFVLDDAFQHRRAARDLDIVCIDATNPFGNGKTLPSGILREPLENLRRADAIVITRANLSDRIADLKSQISKYNSASPIFLSENKISELVDLTDFLKKDKVFSKIKDQKSKIKNRSLAFCALGNPQNFFDQLRVENFNVVAEKNFPDHHFYTPKDVRDIFDRARQNNVEFLLTTAKDAVKLRNLQFDLPCYVVENDLRFDRENDFRRLLTSANRKS